MPILPYISLNIYISYIYISIRINMFLKRSFFCNKSPVCYKNINNFLTNPIFKTIMGNTQGVEIMNNTKRMKFFSVLIVAMTMISTLVVSTFTTIASADDEVNVILDGANRYEVGFEKKTVEEVLKDAGISVGEEDVVAPNRKQTLYSPALIVISRVSYVEVTVEEEIQYQTITTIDWNKKSDYSRTVKTGSNGVSDVTYRIKMIGGVEASREEIGRTQKIAPVNEEIVTGGIDISSARLITCTATAYDGSYATLGKYNPRTCTGAVPTANYTVAVDPRVIPLGSKLYIETSDGSYVFGSALAEDTGGAIKGNRVDLFMGSRSEALRFGRRTVNVYVLD